MIFLRVSIIASFLTLVICVPPVFPDTSTTPAEELSLLERLGADLHDLDLDELRERAEEVMRATTTQAQDSQDLMGRYQEARQKGREHEAIRARQEEINQLRKELEQAIDELPEVAEVLHAVNESRRELFELMELRTRIQRLIAIGEFERRETPSETESAESAE